MQRALRIVSGTALVLLHVVLMRLAFLEAAGPSHYDLVIGGETPATFYLPGSQWSGTGVGSPPRVCPPTGGYRRWC